MIRSTWFLIQHEVFLCRGYVHGGRARSDASIRRRGLDAYVKRFHEKARDCSDNC